MLAEEDAAAHASQPGFGSSQPAFPPLALSSQPDPWASQPGGFSASQPEAGLLGLPSSQDGLPGGWHAAACYGSPTVKQEPVAEPPCSSGLGSGPAADPHAAASQEDHSLSLGDLKLEAHDAAVLERHLNQSQPQLWSQDPHWEEEQRWQEQHLWQEQQWQHHHSPPQAHLVPQGPAQPLEPLSDVPLQLIEYQLQPQLQRWVPQPEPQPQPWEQQQAQQAQQAQPQPWLHQMFQGQQAQQQQLAEAEAGAGCGSAHLLLSPAAALAGAPGSEGAAMDAVQPAGVDPPATAKLAAAGSRKRKAQQAADSSPPPAKRAAGTPTKQATAAVVQRSKSSGGSRQPAHRGGSKSVVRGTAKRVIDKKKSLQPCTPAEQQLQPAALVEAAAGKAAAKQRQQAQLAQQGRAPPARQQAGKVPASQQQKQKAGAAGEPRAAKAVPQQQPAAPKAAAAKPASKAAASKAAAGCGSGKAGSSSKAAASGSSKAAARSSKVGGRKAASARKAKPGTRVRVSRPCTGNQTGRRKGGMNVPPEKLFLYHMDLLGKGGKRKLAEEFGSRTDSMAVKTQAFLRGLVEPKMQLKDASLMHEVGNALSRKPALSLDKERLKVEGITSFDAFCAKYLLPPGAEQPVQPKQQAKQPNPKQPKQQRKQGKQLKP
ncbi:hypothetical protein C2E21_5896 [Chlorella sorokiniana]|uniref:Uncharacterized protein n=1 Tax=Chlorella sorokiniana TaxID=3076 RepID=A0A2P6TMC0_CHLSO|nr:hypothetical protein C2E21_5896 [Chlorella sorokiniana]|eukprot:PRW45497.1 hypothetical protein C2E21_5896 [Chlorella sorokiniana]